MTDNPEYEYGAFISYRHRPDDRAFAEWLLESLETFQTPDRLLRDGYPAGFGKVFRDDDELRAEAELTPAIRRALWASRYLVVVCSPATPSSAWVRAEIRMFQHWGRGDRIIPVLIDGDPEQSFPPELVKTVVSGEGPDAEFRTEMPRGPMLLPEQGKTEDELKERALLTIAATMLGCAYGQLRDRVEERVRKQTTTELYEQLAWRRGAPVGIGPLDEANAACRQASWRFECRGGRVVRLLRVNSFGNLVPDDKGMSRIDIHYRDDGGVERVIHRDRHEVVKRIERYNASQTIVDFTHEDDSASPVEAFGSGLGLVLDSKEEKRKSTILRHRLEYGEAGFVVRRLFCRDTFNTPGRDALGHFGQAFERNERGQSVRTWAIDADGSLITQRNGIAFEVFSYNSAGRETESRFLDADAAPISSMDGYAQLTLAYDASGNVIEEAYFDQNGAPVLHKEGYARTRAAYDGRGNLIEQAYFGVDGAPVLDRNGYTRRRFGYDARGNLVDEAYFGQDGAPVLSKGGYASGKLAHDARGNVIEVAYFGLDGAPVLGKDGVARFTIAYDGRGNMIELAYFGPDGKPALNKNGFARTTVAYDARGNRVETVYFGTDGARVLDKNGVAQLTLAYDARGNVIEEAYFDQNGAPVLRKEGYARATCAYDTRGNVIEQAFFGPDGATALHKDGYARATATYDVRGNQVERAYFGVDGAPVLHKDGFVRFTSAYDARGNLIERACFGLDGAPTLYKEGYARFTAAYDVRGDLIEKAFFGTDGAPVLQKDGIARFTSAYDGRGNLIEQAYFGVDGAPVLDKGGVARFTSAYDARGDLIEKAFFGTDGAPVLDKHGVARFTSAYDARGNLIEQAYFDVDGAPVLDKDGVARVTCAYDVRGNQVKMAYFGVDGAPVLHKDGYARVTCAYDARGNLIELAYFGLDGFPIARRAVWQEYASFNGLFGEWQGLILRGLFSEQELDGGTSTGFARVERQLDPRGHEIERRYKSPDGGPANGPEGFAHIVIDVDALGNPLQVTPTLADGTKALHLRFSYTERRQIERVEFLDDSGQAAVSKLGFASVVFLYDERHQKTGANYLNAEGTVIKVE